MQTRKGLIRVLALLALALTLFTSAASAAGQRAVVKVASLEVRAKPKAKAKVVATLSKGDEVVVIGASGKVAKVRCAGKTGYTLKSGLKLVKGDAAKVKQKGKGQEKVKPAPKAAAQTTRSTARRAWAYRQPNGSARKVGVRKGTAFRILGAEGDFYKVERGGQVGYVLKSAFEAQPAKAPAPARGATDKAPAPARQSDAERPANDAKAGTVISAAMAQLGKRYVFGSTGPDTFDCSGLTAYAYKKVGVSLPHSAQEVGYNAGQKVERKWLKRGDIVCFDTVADSDRSDHVGIYMGKDQFVHASSGKGRVVVSDISGYYSDNFSWGRRVF
ncbi:MAG: SH3 domain-containing C40 family peptidase [Christensenellaceae bacterium]|nr:SH3 domain-containing C40 family peptidase [Christensenellaceae bacterium]